jgi:aldose 1-epimerase
MIELAAGAARAAVDAALGGTIDAFTWHGEPVLRPTPPQARAERNVRLSACYPLVPYSNRIRNALLAFSGVRHRLARNFGDHPHAIHGVGWQRAWTVVASSATHATMALEHDAQGDAAMSWPWPFRAVQMLDLAASVGGAALTATLTIENTGSAPFPFGLGWHPFFARDPTTSLQFEARHVWINDETRLPVERIPAAGAWSFDPPRLIGEATLDHVFCAFGGRATLRSPARAFVTTLEADTACRHLVVYAPAGRDFAAIEPVTHETDAFNRAAEGAADTGTRVLPPGGAFSCTMRVAVADTA